MKEQLEANQRGVMIDENGKEVMVHNARREIVEKIVEREVIKEVRVVPRITHPLRYSFVVHHSTNLY